MIRADGRVTRERRLSWGKRTPDKEADGRKSVEVRSGGTDTDETDMVPQWPKGVKRCYPFYKKYRYRNVK